MTAKHLRKNYTETASQAYERNKAEALTRLEEIKQAILAGEHEAVNWGHVGSLTLVVKALGEAGHYAGVTRLTER